MDFVVLFEQVLMTARHFQTGSGSKHITKNFTP